MTLPTVKKVLVACEFSGIVRDAFSRRGFDAWSCDLLPSESAGNHIQGDLQKAPKDWFRSFDLVVAFPPCTYLAVSGARWFSSRLREQQDALDFVNFLLGLDVPRIALEQPVGVVSTKIRKPDQIIQPWQFGHGETKKTCLWLKGLPSLTPTKVVEGRLPRVHFERPGPDRWKARSRTLLGLAEAMADQWGAALVGEVKLADNS